MNCNEAIELISAAVDNRLDLEQKEKFNKHIETCPKCKREYILELETKNCVSFCISKYDVPPNLRQKIFFQIKDSNYSYSLKSLPVKKKTKYKYWYLVFPIILIVVVFIINYTSTHNHPINLNENNILKIVYNNFDEVLNGNKNITLKTSDPTILEAKLESGGDIDVQMPRLLNCELLGGWTSTEFGKKVIHTLYKDGEDLIYCSQLNFNDLLNSSQLYIDNEILNKLKQDNKYIHHAFRCCSVILWKKENQLYIVAAEMDTNKLIAHIQE